MKALNIDTTTFLKTEHVAEQAVHNKWTILCSGVARLFGPPGDKTNMRPNQTIILVLTFFSSTQALKRSIFIHLFPPWLRQEVTFYK